MQSSLQVRESVAPTTLLPIKFIQVDAWLQPKLLEAIPAQTKTHIESRARTGQVDESHLVLFWVLKQFVPGGIEEQLALIQCVRNPKCCYNARPAQLELMRWKESIRRMIDLELPPIPLFEAYMALSSIFSGVFEKADQQLNLRWVQLQNDLGLPHQISGMTLTKVSAFAEQELGALALLPNANSNTGLPFTDNQKAHPAQKSASDKKRAAAAQDKQQKKVIDAQQKAVAAAVQVAV